MYPVTLNWVTNSSMDRWDKVCIWVIDHFGLPGDRYTTEINENWLRWNFKSKQDQLMFVIAWGQDSLAKYTTYETD
jgi:hypothetical protein